MEAKIKSADGKASLDADLRAARHQKQTIIVKTKIKKYKSKKRKQ